MSLSNEINDILCNRRSKRTVRHEFKFLTNVFITNSCSSVSGAHACMHTHAHAYPGLHSWFSFEKNRSLLHRRGLVPGSLQGSGARLPPGVWEERSLRFSNVPPPHLPNTVDLQLFAVLEPSMPLWMLNLECFSPNSLPSNLTL